MGWREPLLGAALEGLNKIRIVSRGIKIRIMSGEKRHGDYLKMTTAHIKVHVKPLEGFEVPGPSPTWQQG